MKNILSFIDRLPKIAGFTTFFSFDGAGNISQLIHQKNMIMDGAAFCVANLLLGDDRYKVGAIYFEFINLADPADSPSPPAFTKDEGVDYFCGLQYSSNRDLLRVPVVANAQIVETESGSYLISFYAITPGDAFGFWNKPFSAANNSAVYGGALVATPNPSSQSNDIVIARNYPEGAKVMKPDGEQIAAVWNIEVRKPE